MPQRYFTATSGCSGLRFCYTTQIKLGVDLMKNEETGGRLLAAAAALRWGGSRRSRHGCECMHFATPPSIRRRAGPPTATANADHGIR